MLRLSCFGNLFGIMGLWSSKLWARRNPSSLKLCLVRYLAKAFRKVTHGECLIYREVRENLAMSASSDSYCALCEIWMLISSGHREGTSHPKVLGPTSEQHQDIIPRFYVLLQRVIELQSDLSFLPFSSNISNVISGAAMSWTPLPWSTKWKLV